MRIKTQKEFIARLTELKAMAVEISRRKNSDYAGDGDPFLNFRAVELLGIDPGEAILVRMMDKMTRAGNLLKRKAMVADESILDTLLDLSNYADILRMFLENRTAVLQEANKKVDKIIKNKKVK